MDKEMQKKILAIVKNGYNQIAPEFNETRNKEWNNSWKELIVLAKKVKRGSLVLDVGCGNGRLLRILPPNIKYLGIDNSRKLISYAQKNFKKNKFIIADLLNLRKKIKEKFDYIFCVAVLHHIPGQDLQIKALKELKALLKKNGKIILTVWNLRENPKFNKQKLRKNEEFNLEEGDVIFNFKNNSGKKIGLRYYHIFSKKELKEISFKADLKIEKFYKNKYNYFIILKN